MSEEKKLRGFLIIIENNPAQRVLSTEDMIQQWKDGLEEIYNIYKKTGLNEFWRPIEFKDEHSNVVGAYAACRIMGVIEGTIPDLPQEKKAP